MYLSADGIQGRQSEFVEFCLRLAKRKEKEEIVNHVWVISCPNLLVGNRNKMYVGKAAHEHRVLVALSTLNTLI